MGPSRTRAGAAPSGLFAALLFCATFAGCEHYCLVVQSNPGGTINTATSCPISTATGNVTLTFGSSLASASATDALSAPLRSPHIFVTLRGIDALPMQMSGIDALPAAPSGEMSGDDAAAWQPLAPQLASRPVQVDLNAHVGDSCAARPVSIADTPAGVYSQLRLRLVPNQPSDRSTLAAPPLDASACGANLLNCLVPPDAAAQPLAFDDPASIVIPSDRIAGGFIRVLPDSSVHLSIAFDPVSSRALPVGNALRFAPVFSVAADAHCSRAE